MDRFFLLALEVPPVFRLVPCLLEDSLDPHAHHLSIRYLLFTLSSISQRIPPPSPSSPVLSSLSPPARSPLPSPLTPFSDRLSHRINCGRSNVSSARRTCTLSSLRSPAAPASTLATSTFSPPSSHARPPPPYGDDSTTSRPPSSLAYASPMQHLPLPHHSPLVQHLPPPPTPSPSNHLLPSPNQQQQPLASTSSSASLPQHDEASTTSAGDPAEDGGEAAEGGAAALKKKSIPKIFRCTGFGECAMSFTRSEHLARHVRYVLLPLPSPADVD